LDRVPASKDVFPGFGEAAVRARDLVVIISLVCVAVSSMAWSNIARSAGPASASALAFAARIDFNQVFADAAAGRRDSAPASQQKLDSIGVGISAADVQGSLRSDRAVIAIARSGKGDRLHVSGEENSAFGAKPVHAIVISKPAAQPMTHCEPVAAPFADAILGRIIGRCFV
jgi:hypothetical protein